MKMQNTDHELTIKSCRMTASGYFSKTVKFLLQLQLS